MKRKLFFLITLCSLLCALLGTVPIYGPQGVEWGLSPSSAFAAGPSYSGGGGGAAEYSTTLPATCTPGTFYIDTDLGSGTLYFCYPANTWVGAASSFISLTDAPASYVGHGGKYVKVKATADGLEFTASTVTGHSLLDSTAHTDSLTGTVIAGDFLYGNITPKWARFPKGTQNQTIVMGASLPAWGTLPVAGGGTGGTDAATARTNLGLVISTNVQAYDADLTTYAGITPSANVQSLLGAADYAAMRTLLALVIGTNVQAYDADLTTYAGITPSANVQSLLAAADYAAMRTLLTLVIGTNVQAYDADLTTYAGITPSANVQSLLGAVDYAAMKTLLSLNSVENTALSTWVGTTNVTTLGTIGTGTWNATAIGATKGGTGQTGYAVGDIIYADTTTSLAKLADVATGNVLLSGGVGAAPAYGKVTEGHITLSDVTTLNVSNTAHGFVPKATDVLTTFLRADGTWATPTGSGDVVGPAASTDGELPLFDSTTGKLLKRSNTLSGYAKLTSGVVSAIASITDADISDTLTASIFKGSGTTTDAIDLATAEVAGTLPLTRGGTSATSALNDSGNTDGIGTDTSVLRDTGQNFLTSVSAGNVVHNTTDGTWAKVISVDSNTQLTLSHDIMDDSEDYSIYASASNARIALGVSIGLDVQAYDADLTTYAGITPSANVQLLLGATDYAAMRTLLGLVIGTNVQAYDADLTTYAGITPSANVQTYLGAATYAAMKSLLSLDNVENTVLSTWTGSANIATVGTVTSGIWSATAVAVAKGGTGATDAATARTNLGVAIGSNVQAYDADLTTYAGITPSANVQSLLGAADYAAMRTLLGLVIGTNVQAYDADLTTYAGITPSANVQSLLGAADYAAMKTLLSLNSVENTALSTWVGTTNVTTLGTIGTGTWNATAIGVAKGGSGKTSYTLYSIPYMSGTTTFGEITIGTPGQYMKVNASGIGYDFGTPSGAGDLKADGTVPLTANWDMGNYTLTLGGITTYKTTGVAGYMGTYEANLTDTSQVGWQGPSSISESWWYTFSSMQPAAGQIMAFAAPTGTGGPGGSKTSAQTWVLPALSPAGAQITFTGPLAARTFALPNADATILTNNAAVTVGQGGSGIASGTSGGVPYFSATNTMASSAALAQYNLVLGGGAGIAPSTLGSLGTTTTVLHGNAIGAPSYAQVNLTTTVTGVLPAANGGTTLSALSANVVSLLGAADYAAMRTQLSLVVGTNVQAYDADLTTYAGITPSANVQSFLGAADYAAMRTQLSLVIGTNVQAYDADLDYLAGFTPTANVKTILNAADYAAIRTALTLVTGTDIQAYDADLTTWAGVTPGSGIGTWLATPSSANFASAFTDESGTGSVAFTDGADSTIKNQGTFASPITTNPLALTAAQCKNNVLWYGATGEIDLPAATAGMNLIIYNPGAFTITIDPNGTDVIVRDGTAQSAGVSFTLSSGAGNYVTLVSDAANHWVTVGYKGTLAQGS